jgi:phenylalanyl-tRNA synthetase beta chain
MNLINLFKKIFSLSTNKSFPGIIAAKVVDIQKHPNADRLRLVKLDAGDKIIEPIVCGAFNFEVGDMVALALPGATIAQNIHTPPSSPPKIGGELKGGFILNKATIRGVESQGMICAAFELGLDKEPGQGIMVLKNGIKQGSRFTPEMIL